MHLLEGRREAVLISGGLGYLLPDILTQLKLRPFLLIGSQPRKDIDARHHYARKRSTPFSFLVLSQYLVYLICRHRPAY